MPLGVYQCRRNDPPLPLLYNYLRIQKILPYAHPLPLQFLGFRLSRLSQGAEPSVFDGLRDETTDEKHGVFKRITLSRIAHFSYVGALSCGS